MELKINKQKTICHSVPKTDIFQNCSVTFHQVIFDHSISCVLLIDKQKKTPKNLKEMPFLPQKKTFKKKRK